MKKLLTILLTVGILLSLGACADNKKEAEKNEEKKVASNSNEGAENKDTEDNKVDENTETDNDEVKTYIIGFDNTFAPMGFEKDGENIGFDIDLSKKMEEKLNVKFEFQPIDWTLKETELESKNIDMIWNGYSITDERKKSVQFSEPYMKNRVLILVNKDSGIKSKADLKGKSVCTQEQSSSLDALNKDEIVKDLSEVITYSSFNEVFSDLKNERCDAIVIDETMGLYYISDNGDSDLIEVLEDDLGSEEYGVGFRKDEDPAFVEKFNKALTELKEEGEVEKIYNKWFK